VIVLYPLLDQDYLGRAISGVLTFVPLILATLKMSQRRGWLWPYVLLGCGAFICGALGTIFSSQSLIATQWTILTVFFGLTVFGLFSYLKTSSTITNDHLYTAASIYLVIGMQRFALYHAIETVFPGFFHHSTAGFAKRPSDLLYFSLITLASVGYGDILPISPAVRMLSALAGVTGVLYVAITVSLLVGAYMQPDRS
jgi:hypothetical protein